MSNKMRIMSEKPLNAETPIPSLRSWITANALFFDRNQGEIPEKAISLADWQLVIEGEVEKPYEGFFMDKVYRVFQKGEDPKSGAVVTNIKLKSIITQPLQDETLPAGPLTILGAAYAGEAEIDRVELSVDGGKTWSTAEFLGPHERFAWRQWQYVWDARKKGDATIMARATDAEGQQQPMDATWNVLGYGNNGIREHAVTVHIR